MAPQKLEQVIKVQIIIQYDEGNQNDFEVRDVMVGGIPSMPDHDGGIDRVWIVAEADTVGHSFLMLKWRPPLQDDKDDGECTINCPGCIYCADQPVPSKTWQWVEAQHLQPGDKVRDMSPWAGYEGTVFSTQHEHGQFLRATIHWRKWEGQEPLVDFKYNDARIEVYR